MAQAQPQESPPQETETASKTTDGGGSGSASTLSSFKFNAQAPVFVPRSHSQVPISGYFYPCHHYLGGSAVSGASPSDWVFVGNHDHATAAAAAFYMSNPSLQFPVNSNPSLQIPINSSSRGLLPDDLRQKIVKQVEYQFTDLSLLANESMSKQMNKDPEGYVPICFITSTKKVKSLTSNQQLVAQALRSSSKLVVSEDGKKVKRKQPFTEKEKEELQSRTVVAENLPEDHSYQNLEKIFGVVGSAKAIRVCLPQESNSSRPKGDFWMSNRLHALVEYATTDIAETAVEKLNDERNWRKGLRVRLLLRCSPKSVLKTRRSDFDGYLDDDDTPGSESTDNSFQPNIIEAVTDAAEGSFGASKKGWTKGRGKGRGRVQSHPGRGPLSPSSQSSQCEATPKPTLKGPRMPDGTKGFTMGRGKPLNPPPPQ